MRIVFAFIIITGAIYTGLVDGHSPLVVHANNILSFWREGEKISAESESMASRTTLSLPLVTESREQATNFQPELKELSPQLNIVSAHASVIMDAQTGKVLYGKNADMRRQVASLTKLLTAVIVMEQIANLDELVTIDEEAVYVAGSKIGCPRSGYCTGVRLRPGEMISVRNLLKAALMNSSNDAAIALGKHVAGSQEAFARMMNAKATALGLRNSHFCTPSGLEPDGREKECYSTAVDMATIAVHALTFPEIWDIMRIEEAVITSHDGQLVHELFNTNELLGQFPNLLGTKTGFTPLAGYSLLAVATDDTARHTVVAVVLDDQSRWQSIRSMFDWSFQAFDWK